MKYIKRLKLNETINIFNVFDLNVGELDALFIDLIDNGYLCQVDSKWRYGSDGWSWIEIDISGSNKDRLLKSDDIKTFINRVEELMINNGYVFNNKSDISKGNWTSRLILHFGK